jgi:hypothetical protein
MTDMTSCLLAWAAVDVERGAECGAENWVSEVSRTHTI